MGIKETAKNFWENVSKKDRGTVRKGSLFDGGEVYRGPEKLQAPSGRFLRIGGLIMIFPDMPKDQEASLNEKGEQVGDKLDNIAKELKESWGDGLDVGHYVFSAADKIIKVRGTKSLQYWNDTRTDRTMERFRELSPGFKVRKR